MMEPRSLDAGKKPMDGKNEASSREVIDVDALPTFDREVIDVDALSDKDCDSAQGSSRGSVQSRKNLAVSEEHLKHPFRNSAQPIRPDVGIIAKLSGEAYMPPALATYFDKLRDQNVEFTNDANPKLIVPSIKRDLAFRYRKEVYARPFLANFMTYLLGPGGDSLIAEGLEQDFLVFMWSTAMPQTLLPMLDTYFSEWRNRILGVWNRDRLDLSMKGYRSNPDTFKDLEKLFLHFRDRDLLGSARQQLLGDFVPNIDNTLLIEERAAKCRLQPLNFITIPDYSEVEHDVSVIAAHGGCKIGLESELKDSKQGTEQDRRTEDRAALFGKIFGSEASIFYERHVSNPAASDLSKDGSLLKLDAYLVALIGILSELRDVASIPVWIAAGGLTPNIDHTFTEDMARGGWRNVVQIDGGSVGIPALRPEPKNHAVPSQLRSASGGAEWFQSPHHVLYWLRRGFVALDERDIEPDHGVGRKRMTATVGDD